MPVIKSTSGLLAVVILLIVVGENGSSKQIPGTLRSDHDCLLVDQEPSSELQEIKFGRNSSISFDASILVHSPGGPSKFIALENGQLTDWDRDNSIIALKFDCAQIGLQLISNNLAMGYITWTAQGKLVSVCHQTEPLHLGPDDGSFTSPNGISTKFNCTNVEIKPSALALRYVKLELNERQ